MLRRPCEALAARRRGGGGHTSVYLSTFLGDRKKRDVEVFLCACVCVEVFMCACVCVEVCMCVCG